MLLTFKSDFNLVLFNDANQLFSHQFDNQGPDNGLVSIQYIFECLPEPPSLCDLHLSPGVFGPMEVVHGVYYSIENAKGIQFTFGICDATARGNIRIFPEDFNTYSGRPWSLPQAGLPCPANVTQIPENLRIIQGLISSSKPRQIPLKS